MNFSERHAGLGRPAGHADTPLDDQQAMLGLHQANCSMLLLDDAHDLTFPKEAQNLRTPHHQTFIQNEDRIHPHVECSLKGLDIFSIHTFVSNS